MLEKREVVINQEPTFGRMLSRARNVTSPKTRKNVALKCEVSENLVASWEYGLSLPARDKLSLVAEVYGISLDELKKEYEISRTMKRNISKNRRSLRDNKPEKPTAEKMFPGVIQNFKTIRRSNEQTPKDQYGRE